MIEHLPLPLQHGRGRGRKAEEETLDPNKTMTGLNEEMGLSGVHSFEECSVQDLVVKH